MANFKEIYQRAAFRKGGPEALQGLLPEVADAQTLARKGDDRYLSAMTRAIFQAGFVWRVIENKWPGFEAVFHGFDLEHLLNLSDEAWQAIGQDERIVRNGQKIATVLPNARFVMETRVSHGGFGRFLADWPEDDLVGLLATLKKRGARLGGTSAQWFLRSMGKDSFMLTRDVVTCLRELGLELKDSPSSKRELREIQAAFNRFREETGMGYAHLSRIMACSIGD